ETFDIVTCRLALHHMPAAGQAIAEMARVCRTGGRVALADNIVPEDEDTATWVNRFETIRDPSHFRLWPLAAIVTMFEGAGLAIRAYETLTKMMDFENWAWRVDVPPADKARLRAMLFDAPPAVQQWLSPREVDGRLKFNLVEGVVLGRK
ncbi:MAG: methyltransferase domain-containing protein, partial [Chloroflexi bacterium]